MRPLATAELLAVWERGRAQRPAQQALLLLSAASPELTPAQLADLTVGQRDAALLTLREWTLGGTISSLASCPRCAERLELAFDTAAIRVPPAADPMLTLALPERTLRLRLPTVGDLAALAEQPTADPRRWLLQRCLLPTEDSAAPPIELWPPELEQQVAAAMAEADPQADVRLALCCPDCAYEWQASFDIVTFFWAELDAWATQQLRDVHTLALAYGWSEAAILALSSWRRQLYLEMVGR